jgi:biopolymer transport protein ExbB
MPPPLLANVIVETFIKGGPIMWPLLICSIVGLAAFAERALWFSKQRGKTDVDKRDKVFAALKSGDLKLASSLSRSSEDPAVRMIWEGLNYAHTSASLPGALQVAAAEEVERAERFLPVLDTIITLAPLLGLLGTVTGIMHSFNFVGNEELAATKVSGGIAEALIATAFGLGTAIFCLIPFNFFNRKVDRLQRELENVATNVEVLVEHAKSPKGSAHENQLAAVA